MWVGRNDVIEKLLQAMKFSVVLYTIGTVSSTCKKTMFKLLSLVVYVWVCSLDLSVPFEQAVRLYYAQTITALINVIKVLIQSTKHTVR